MTKFTKKDLKTGMIVESRSGRRYMVLRSPLEAFLYGKHELFFISEKIFSLGEHYTDTLTSAEGRASRDIMKIYGPPVLGLTHMFDECNDNNLIWERKEVDWTKVPVDTKILVKNSENGKWEKRYFAKYENGRIYAFSDGGTSWSAEESIFAWKYVKLAEDDEE